MKLYNFHDVAEILAEAFSDECSCNHNDIIEWLPNYCEYANTTCPYPDHQYGCWEQYVLHREEHNAKKKK